MSTPRSPHTPSAGPAPLELAAIALLAVTVAVGLVVWATGWLLTAGQQSTGPADIPTVIGRLLAQPGDPAGAWPAADQPHLPGPAAFYATATTLAALPITATTAVVLRLRRRHRGGEHDARWARRSDLAPLAVRTAGGGRLVYGRHHPSGRLVAGEPSRSLLVLGPSRSGKTTGLAIPAILEWDGPVIATSVKTDLVRDTAGWRATTGQVQLYDPTGSTGQPAAGWTPLAAATSWAGAVRTAHRMAAVTRTSGTAGGLTDGDFWYASAAKLLAPLLYAAAAHDLPIAEVLRWLNTQEQRQVARLLQATGSHSAIDAFTASTSRADNQKSSIYTTAETVLAAYEDPTVAASATTCDINPDRLLAGNDTLYLCAPRDDQRRLRPLFVGLLSEILAAADRTAAAQPDGQLPRPLLVVLDEAANIAPLPDLDELAATAMGLGITLVTIWQDLAQIRARYGHRAPTIVNNHAGMLVLRGMRDLDALTTVADLLGRHTPPPDPTDPHRRPPSEPLLPAHAIRSLPEGHAIGIYQHLPPIRLRLRPHYATATLRRRTLPPPATSPPPPPQVTDPAPADTATADPPAAVPRPADTGRKDLDPDIHPEGDNPNGETAGLADDEPADTVEVPDIPDLAYVRGYAEALQRIAATHGATDVRLFGSVARGTAVPGSDINLLIDIPPTRRLLQLAGIAEQATALLGHPVRPLCRDMLHTPAAADDAIPLTRHHVQEPS